MMLFRKVKNNYKFRKINIDNYKIIFILFIINIIIVLSTILILKNINNKYNELNVIINIFYLIMILTLITFYVFIKKSFKTITIDIGNKNIVINKKRVINIAEIKKIYIEEVDSSTSYIKKLKYFTNRPYEYKICLELHNDREKYELLNEINLYIVKKFANELSNLIFKDVIEKIDI